MIEEVKIQNLTTGLSCNLDQENSEYLLEDITISDLRSSYDDYSVYGKVGRVLNDIQLSQPREIQITGWFINNKICPFELKKRFVSQFFNPLQKLRLTFKDRCIEGYSKTSVKFGASYKDNNPKFCKFQATVYCPYPLFKSVEPNKIAIPVNPVGSYTAPEGYKVQELIDNTLTFDYAGDVPTGFKATFRAVEDETQPTYIGWGIRVRTNSDMFQTLYGDDMMGIRVLDTTSTSSRGFYSVPSRESDQLQPMFSELDPRYAHFVQIMPGENAFVFSSAGTTEDTSLDCEDILFEYEDEYIYPKEEW